MKIEIGLGRKKENRTKIESKVASLKNCICKDCLSQLPTKERPLGGRIPLLGLRKTSYDPQSELQISGFKHCPRQLNSSPHVGSSLVGKDNDFYRDQQQGSFWKRGLIGRAQSPEIVENLESLWSVENQGESDHLLEVLENSFGAPTGGYFDQGLFSACSYRGFRGFSWFLELLEWIVFQWGLLSNFHLVVSVVLAISSVKKRATRFLNNSLPALRSFETLEILEIVSVKTPLL